MDKEEWNTYVNSGEVPYHFFKSMVDLIKQGKRLNEQHLAVYMSHGEIIEALLKNNK